MFYRLGSPVVCLLFLSWASPALSQSSVAEMTARTNQLEEQVRQLNGKVEDLSFQLLQLQEQIRKMQEDNEFRFQELEEKKSGLTKPNSNVAAGAETEDSSLGKSQPSEDTASATPSGGKITRIVPIEPNDKAKPSRGEPPRSLGTLSFDEQGNVIDSAVGKPLDLTRPVTQPPLAVQDGVESEPTELIRTARNHYQAGDYALASKTLRLYLSQHPKHADVPQMEILLGESLFAVGDFHGAATMFLNHHNTHPASPRGAEVLLKLGLSMAGLNERAVACATYAEVLKQYPEADVAIRQQVAIQQESAKCS
ncbi:MAG: tetratricopeptide repeat protein [Pseudomonadota bacterium]